MSAELYFVYELGDFPEAVESPEANPAAPVGLPVVLDEHHTWANARKNNCLRVKLRPGNQSSSSRLADQFSKAWKAAFNPPLSAMFSPATI